MGKEAIHVTEAEKERQRMLIQQIRDLPHRPQTYHIVTYGCQMNAHDSEKIAGMLEEMGIAAADKKEDADFVIFNTCCVRDNAERRALGNVTWLKEIRRNRPQMMIAVCGCMVQEPGMAEKIMKQYSFVDLAFGTANLHQFPELLYTALNSDRSVVVVSSEERIAEGIPVHRLRRESAYVTIMYGCDNFCSFCIVPYVRGRERSRRPEDIIREAADLQSKGVREIMLLGQNVNSYGKGLDNPMNFSELLRQLDQLEIPRIRFMTSHPKDLSDELISVMSDSRHILPQFHLPVQSGNDEILRRMNRHYTREEYLDRVSKLRAAIPDIGLSTDIIVGFPGETEPQFEDTLSLVEEVRFDSAFTFIYSPRKGTRAAAMEDQVPEQIANQRIRKLIELQETLQKKTLQRFVGMEEEVLIEGFSKRSMDAVSGKGKHAVSITMPGTASDIGQIVRCRVTGVKNNTLTAERI